MTRPSLLVPLALSSFLLAGVASARMVMPPRIGDIPDDLREVSGSPNANGVSTLRRFAHQPWLTGGSIAFLPGEQLLVVADTDNSALVVVNAQTGAKVKTIAVGRRPERLVVAPDGTVFVTNRGSRSVSVVAPRRGVELRTISAGVEPMGLALTADAKLLLVTSSATRELLAIDVETSSIRFSLEVADWPMAVTAHPDGKRAFVSHLHAPTVEIVDIERQRIVHELTLPNQDTGLPSRLQGRFQNKRFANQAVSATVSPGGNRLFVAHVMVDTGSNRSASMAVGGYGMGAFAPIVATVSTFDLEKRELIRPKVDFSKATRNGGQIFNQDLAVQMIQQPRAILHDPRHARLFMVGHGSDRVLALNTRASDPITKPLTGWSVGQAPEGIAVNAAGTVAFVHDSHAYAVSRIALDDTTRPVANQQFTNKTHGQFVFAKTPLPEDAAKGRRLFTFALDARIGGGNRFACASCHPDGRHDGLTWQVGAGPRQTPILADRLNGSGPFNWLGTEDKLHDNIKQTMRRLGGSAVKEEEVGYLVNYMTRYMPTPDNPNRTQNAALVALGKKVFHAEETGCSGCHDSGNRFTDGGKHEVGTTTKLEFDLWEKIGKHQAKNKRGNQPGGPPGNSMPRQPQQNQIMMNDEISINPIGMRVLEPIPEAPVAFKTPSLRQLWASAPYYHDGGQSSLRDLLSSGNKGDRMGKTSHLSKREIDGLVAYLKTL